MRYEVDTREIGASLDEKANNAAPLKGATEIAIEVGVRLAVEAVEPRYQL